MKQALIGHQAEIVWGHKSLKPTQIGGKGFLSVKIGDAAHTIVFENGSKKWVCNSLKDPKKTMDLIVEKFNKKEAIKIGLDHFFTKVQVTMSHKYSFIEALTKAKKMLKETFELKMAQLQSHFNLTKSQMDDLSLGLLPPVPHEELAQVLGDLFAKDKMFSADPKRYWLTSFSNIGEEEEI